MPIINGKYKNPGWTNNQPPAINSTELNAISDTLEQLDAQPQSELGITWTPIQEINGIRSVERLGYGNGRFWGAGITGASATNRTLLYTDENGDWKTISLPSSDAWYYAFYGDGKYFLTSLARKL